MRSRKERGVRFPSLQLRTPQVSTLITRKDFARESPPKSYFVFALNPCCGMGCRDLSAIRVSGLRALSISACARMSIKPTSATHRPSEHSRSNGSLRLAVGSVRGYNK